MKALRQIASESSEVQELDRTTDKRRSKHLLPYLKRPSTAYIRYDLQDPEVQADGRRRKPFCHAFGDANSLHSHLSAKTASQYASYVSLLAVPLRM